MFIKNTRKERTQVTKEQRRAAANQRSIENAEKTRMVLREKKMKKYGIDPTSTYDNGEITTNFIQYMTDDSQPILKEYCLKLIVGEMKDKDGYFLPSDGKIHELVKNFYDSEFGTPVAEIAIIDLTRWYNILRRQITGKPYDLSEKSIMGKVCQSYKTGNNLKGGVVRLVGKESHRNILKEVAWVVTHAYCTGLFATHKGIFAMLPKDNDQVITLWNGYIAAQTDIPESVRKLFTYDVDTGDCEFLRKYKSKYSMFKDNGNVKPEDDPAFEENEFVDIKCINLSDDEDIKAKNKEMDEQYKEAMARDDKQATIISDELKSLAHNNSDPMTDQEIQIAKEKIKETDPKTVSVEEITEPIPMSSPEPAIQEESNNEVTPDKTLTPAVEFTFGQLKRSSKQDKINPLEIAMNLSNGNGVPVNPTAVTTDEVASAVVTETTEEAQNTDADAENKEEKESDNTALDITEVNPSIAEDQTITDVEVISAEEADKLTDIYAINNEKWHNSTYRLERFTNLVNAKGFRVFYNRSIEYPGLIQAVIDDDGAVINNVILDDCSIYGDTLRAVTNYNKKHDIRKEIFVPISQESDIEKIINGKLSVADKERLISKLPKCIIYCKGKYTYIDRVDMSGLHVGEIRGMDFETWKNLVTEIGKLVLEPDLTCIRWRIEYDKNTPGKLTMYADNKVQYPFHSTIEGEPSNIAAVKNKLCVEVDLSNHTDDGVAVYKVKQLATSDSV